MLKRTASMGEAEIQARVTAMITSFGLLLDFDLALSRALRIRTIHEPLGIS
jgi:hypothetical protein